jgi:hypothetical protein
MLNLQGTFYKQSRIVVLTLCEELQILFGDGQEESDTI